MIRPVSAIYDSDELDPNFCDEIQGEVNKYYIPRPVWESGTPIHLGQRFHEKGFQKIETVVAITFDGNWVINDVYDIEDLEEAYIEDSADLIYEDAQNLSLQEYADRYGFADQYVNETYLFNAVATDLLDRLTNILAEDNNE